MKVTSISKFQYSNLMSKNWYRATEVWINHLISFFFFVSWWAEPWVIGLIIQPVIAGNEAFFGHRGFRLGEGRWRTGGGYNVVVWCLNQLWTWKQRVKRFWNDLIACWGSPECRLNPPSPTAATSNIAWQSVVQRSDSHNYAIGCLT